MAPAASRPLLSFVEIGRARIEALRAVRQDASRRARVELPLAREVWSLAWPAIAHMLLVTLTFFAGRVMVGRASSTALASLHISATLTWVAYTLFTAFSAGTLAVVARSVGAGDREAAARAARSSLLLALALGLVVAIPLRVANGALLAALFPHAEPAVLADASAYLHIVLPALPLSFVEAAAAASLQGAGDTRRPLGVAAAGSIANIFLSNILIFGHLGAPALGVRGAAIGHAATMSIEGVLLAAALFSSRSPIPLRRVRADRASLRRVLAVSGPAFAEKGVYHAGYLSYVAIVGLLGATAMAANQALLAIEAVCFLSADGFGVAAGALVAQKLGAGKSGEAERAGLFAAMMSTALLTALGAVFLLAPRPLVAVFSSDAELVTTGAKALVVAGVAQPFMAFATVIGMSLRGAGDTRTALRITLVCGFFVRLAATWLLAITLDLGLVGVWLGSTADWVARTAMLAVAYRRGRWRAVQI
jgi:multidrug resistance protein, MATE family